MNANLKIYPNKYSDITYNAELFKTSLVSMEGRKAVIKLVADPNDSFLSLGMKGAVIVNDMEHKLKEVIVALIESGADLNMKDDSGRCARDIAKEYPHINEIWTMLVKGR